MPAGDYIEGTVLFGAMLGGVLAGAFVLTRRRLGHLEGAARAVAFALIATLGVIAVHLLPALLGLLGRGSVLVAVALWVTAAAVVPAAAAGEPARPDPGLEDRASAWPAWILGAGLAVFGLAFMLDQAAVAPGSIDILNFHLPGVVRWIESGSIWQVDNLLPYVAPGNYPNNGDVILLAAILPWHNDFLSHLAMYPFWALTGVATYALGRELGARRSAAALGGAAVVAIPAVAAPALAHSLVDTVMLFGFGAGLAFLVRHQRTGATADLVLAGLGLGLAFGTKWYGVSSVAVVFAVWVLAGLAQRRGWRAVARQGLALAGLIALAGGIWMVRNTFESGNPVFPVKVAPAGVTIFDAPPDIIRATGGSTILDYVGQWDVWARSLDDDPQPGDAYILPQFRRALAAPAGVIALGAVVAVAVLARRRSRRRVRRSGLWLAASAAAALIVAAYAITPYTAGGPEGQPFLVGADSRYVVPALVIAAGLAAGLVTWAGSWISPLAGALALVAVLDGVRWASRGVLTPGRLEFTDWIGGALVLAALAGLGLAVARARRRDEPLARRVLAIGTAVVVLAAVAGGYEAQQRFNDDRYRGGDPVLDYIAEEAPSGHRIGLAGAWDDVGTPPVLPAFGPRFGNRVEYVGRPFKEMLYPYERGDEFAERLRADGFDYLIVGRGRPGVPEGDEARWAREAGFQRVLTSDRFVLLAAPS